MADVFFKIDALNLLKKKHIVFFGDSNARAMYKDLIWLLNYNKLVDQGALKRKQEPSFCGDKLKKASKLHRGREYEEERSYKRGDVQVDFYFINKCYNPLLVDMMEDIHLGMREAPDIIYINSTLWDVSRWGPNGVVEFKDNLVKLARLFKSSLPTSTLMIWATALPVSSKVRSSLLIKQIDFLQHTLRFDVMEANQFARQVMVAHGFDVLDNHFHMRMQVHRRVHDGIHYYPVAIRLLTNLLLTHIALSWDSPLPNRVETILLNKTKALCGGSPTSPVPEVKTPKVLSNKPNIKPSPPPHVLTKTKSYNKPKPSKSFEKEGKSKDWKRSPYKRNGQNNFRNDRPTRVNTREHDRHHQRRNKGINRRNTGWRQESGETRSWRETPAPAPPSPWFNPWMTNDHPNTNWSEDHWPDGQPFQNSQTSSILAHTGQLLAQTVQRHIVSSNRYLPY